MDQLGSQFSNFSLDQILSETDYSKRTTKIVSDRPACWEVDTLVKMIDAGMSVARLNFSHGDHKLHKATLDKL